MNLLLATAIVVCYVIGCAAAFTRGKRELAFFLIGLLSINALSIPDYKFGKLESLPLEAASLVGLVGVCLIVTLSSGTSVPALLGRFLRNNFALVFGGLVAIMMAQLLRTDETAYGISKIKNIVIYSSLPILAIVTMGKITASDIRWLAIAICISCLGLAVVMLLKPQTHLLMAGSRLSITPKIHPILVSRNIGCGVAMLINVYLFRKRTASFGFPLLIMAVFSVVPMLMTGSRGPFLAVGVSIVLTVLMSGQRRSIIRLITTGVLSVAAILAFITLPLDQIDRLPGLRGLNVGDSAARITRQFNRLGDNSSDTSRLDRYRVAWDGFMDSNLAGIGTGGFLRIWTGRPPGGIEADRDYPHNLFLEAAVELGLPGLMTVAAMIVLIGIRLFRRRGFGPLEEHVAIALSLFLFASCNAMVSGDIGTNYLFFVSGAILYAALEKPALIQSEVEPDVI